MEVVIIAAEEVAEAPVAANLGPLDLLDRHLAPGLECRRPS